MTRSLLAIGPISPITKRGGVDLDIASNHKNELAAGRSLREILRHADRLPLPVHFSLFVANEICRELEQVHSKRDPATHRLLCLTHGAISVDSIWIGLDGTVRLMGWKASSGGDFRQDLFAVGEVLFELISGKARDPAAKNFQRISLLNPSVNPELERIVLKALSTTASLRYPDAGTFQRSLQRFLQENFPDYGKNQIAESMDAWFPGEREKIQHEAIPEPPPAVPLGEPLAPLVEPPASLVETPTPAKSEEPSRSVPIRETEKTPLVETVERPAPFRRTTLFLVWLEVGIVILTLIVLFFCSRAAQAETKPVSLKVEIGTSGHFSSSEADRLAGVDYSKKFSTAFDANLRIGTLLLQTFYLGAVYDYWFAGRRFTQNGVETRDTLLYHSVGAEAGFEFSSNPRVFWRLAAIVLYPMGSEVNSVRADVVQTFKGTRSLSYQASLSVGFRLTKRFSALLHGGYRSANLKNLENSGNSYLPGAANFDLSGAFLGLGFATQF